MNLSDHPPLVACRASSHKKWPRKVRGPVLQGYSGSVLAAAVPRHPQIT
jgi:hypothetical protein